MDIKKNTHPLHLHPGELLISKILPEEIEKRKI